MIWKLLQTSLIILRLQLVSWIEISMLPTEAKLLWHKFPQSIQVFLLFLVLFWVQTCVRTIMAASSWNDNGQKQFVHDPCKILPLLSYLTSYLSVPHDVLLMLAKIICRCTLPIRFFSWPGVDAEEIDLG